MAWMPLMGFGIKQMKEEILQKSLTLFLKHGIKEMSNQTLVDWLGISTKTIYKYFQSKEGLLEEALYLYHHTEYEKLLNLSNEQNAACHFFKIWEIAIEMEHQINPSFYKDLEYYYPDLVRKVEKVIGPKFEEYFLSVINRAIAQGAFRSEILPEAALRSVLAMHRASVSSETFQRLGLSTMDLYLQTTANYIRGMCTPEGLIALEKHIQTHTLSKSAEKQLITD
jgi:AcrR family transcriptional regulator